MSLPEPTEEMPPIEQDIVNLDINDDKTESKPKKAKKKSVGFAPLPEEDLKEHHEVIHKKEVERMKSNPFHRIPNELKYLEKKNSPNPKPIPSSLPVRKVVSPTSPTSPTINAATTTGLGKLRHLPIKDFSVQNKQTELNFDYPSIDLPIPATSLLVKILYTSLNSYDLHKINKYLLNVSNVKIGLGYEYVGEVREVGTSFKTNDAAFKIGDKVYGMIDPLSKKGTLSTSLLINPNRDVVIKVTDPLLAKLQDIDIEISFAHESEARTRDNNENFDIDSSSSSEIEESSTEISPNNTLTNEEGIPSLSKLSTFSVLYSKAKQILSHSNFSATSPKATVLINGADTNLGYTLVQILLSSLYDFQDRLSLILVIKRENEKLFGNFIANLRRRYYDPSKQLNISIVTFDQFNDDLILKGEKVPIKFKPLDTFLNEVADTLLLEGVNEENINDYKVDLFVDIIGSRRMFQVDGGEYKLKNPYFINTSSKISYLQAILRPKSTGSCYVSCCNFNLYEPSYEIEKLLTSGGESESSSTATSSVWSSKWSANLFNKWTAYNYYEEFELKLSKKWILEAIELVLLDQLKFKIDDVIDWRVGLKNYIKRLRQEDKKFIFSIEEFS
ncbi:uncharacterized protein RJT21DRAFT_119206 [Scheffersomyces amazonensis]|uniref:uncharacterized protein n=1 Tax=Scheffersomyces amazonensis TaxID=1078765 RepID=UPI00315C4E15